MADRPDLAALLAAPARAAEVPMADVPALLDAVTMQKARLETLTSILAARLATVPSNGTGNLTTAADELGGGARGTQGD